MLAKSLNLIQTSDTWNALMFEGDDLRKLTQHRKLKIHSRTGFDLEFMPYRSYLYKMFLIGKAKQVIQQN